MQGKEPLRKGKKSEAHNGIADRGGDNADGELNLLKWLAVVPVISDFVETAGYYVGVVW